MDAPVDYQSAIEALDRKVCRVHTLDDWRRVGEKSQRAPATLTDDDIVILGYFDGEQSAATARARRAKALAPPVPVTPPVATRVSATSVAKAAPTSFEEFLQRYGSKTVTYRDLTEISDEILSIAKAQKERADKLETRIKDLESRPVLKYAGVYVEGQSYQEGQLVTRSGSLWLSTAATATTPGTPGAAWRLIVKRGKA
jgi:hypothetical protein